MAEINIDYIGVVKETKDHHVEYVQIPINNTYQELVGTLEDMASNPNMTVLDMQSLFDHEFRNAQNGYNFCYPYSYSASYIYGAVKQKALTYKEYQEKLSESSNRDGTKQALKDNYKGNCLRYVKAVCYYRQLNELKADDSNKMFSTETIGWTTYNYDINEDIKVEVRTNFGYGSSANFFVNLNYKGINILPYSMMITYFYANMYDLVRYTRMYDTKRSSWDIALGFVAETSNEAKKNPLSFVSKWILNEVEAMITGLRRISDNPNQYFSNHMGNPNCFGLASIRNIMSSEITTYRIYPSEMVLAKQAEKISGALSFLENLEALSVVYPQIVSAIETIKDLNLKHLPTFEYKIQQITKEAEQRQVIVDSLKHRKDSLIEQCKPHEDKISEIKKEKEEKTGVYVPEYKIREEYCATHYDYKTKQDEISKLSTDISEKETDIWQRKRFAEQISDCVNAIKEKLQLSA